MAGYLTMTLVASLLLRWLEKRLEGSGNYELVQTDPLITTAGTYNYPGKGSPFDESSREHRETMEEGGGSMNQPILQVQHLSKSFGRREILRDIDFSVFPGDVISIIGASGSGKSTLLRCINLLETPTGGKITFHGQDQTLAGNQRRRVSGQGGHGVPVLQSV